MQFINRTMSDETMPLSAFVFTHNFTFVWFVCILPLVLLSHGDSVSYRPVFMQYM